MSFEYIALALICARLTADTYSDLAVRLADSVRAIAVREQLLCLESYSLGPKLGAGLAGAAKVHGGG